MDVIINDDDGDDGGIVDGIMTLKVMMGVLEPTEKWE